MSKRESRSGGERRGEREGGFGSTPFREPLRGMRAGPECLECRQPVDAREGWSAGNPRGNRRSQRQGWLHAECERSAELRLAARQGKTREPKEGEEGPQLVKGYRLEVPVWTEDELAEVLRGRGNWS